MAKRKAKTQQEKEAQIQRQIETQSTLISWNDQRQDVTILANEYFNGVKTKAQKITAEAIKKQIAFFPAQIEELNELGQTALANKLKKNIVSLVKERILLENGFDTYVYRNDVTKYIELVKDKKVYICELEKFPRLIPESAKRLLRKAKELNVFKDFWVVYVDYTGDSDKMLTPAEKQERKKNRDPIIFGTFEKPEQYNIDKMYFICDWTDEYCDLTLDKMVKKLVEDDSNYKPKKIVKDINKYVNAVLMEEELAKPTKETFTDKVKKFFKIK